MQRGLSRIEKAIMSGPALTLPDWAKPSDLYIHERRGTALGVLAQKLETLTRVVAYLSWQSDQTAKGWPPYLLAVTATSALLRRLESEHLLSQSLITIWAPHQVQALVSSKGTEWLSPRRLIQLQAMLLDNPVATIKTCHMLNPATLLPTETRIY